MYEIPIFYPKMVENMEIAFFLRTLNCIAYQEISET